MVWPGCGYTAPPVKSAALAVELIQAAVSSTDSAVSILRDIAATDHATKFDFDFWRSRTPGQDRILKQCEQLD
jgi:hypothetical protein